MAMLMEWGGFQKGRNQEEVKGACRGAWPLLFKSESCTLSRKKLNNLGTRRRVMLGVYEHYFCDQRTL
jgi:hypothetical protein